MLSDDQAVPAATPDGEMLGATPPGVPFARPTGSFYPPPPAERRDPFLLPGLPVGAAWADFALIVLAMLALEFVLFGGIHLWLLRRGEPIPDDGATPAVLQRVLVPVLALRALGACVIIGVLIRVRGLGAASVGLRKDRFLVDVVLGIAATAVLFATIWVTMVLVWLAWPALLDEMQENARRLMDLVPPLGPFWFLPVALTIGTYEELLFRGFLMTRLRRATGSWSIAVVLSTVLFTILHAMDQTRAALIASATLSLVLSLLTIWRRSIVPAIVAHALFDYVQFLLLGLASQEA
jgi:membrane protease YdiL (CAAX protease family)